MGFSLGYSPGGKGTTGRQELGVWGLLDHCGPSSKKAPALLFPCEWWVPLSRTLRLRLVIGEEWDLCVRLGGRKEGALFLIRPRLKSMTNEVVRGGWGSGLA